MKTMPPNPPVRLPLVDALRGLAVAQMIVYHFIYDLTYFGWYGAMMTRDPAWVAWRTAIVTQFVLLIGVSLVLRTQFKPAGSDFWRRWAQVAGAAALVSAGSWFVFGPRFIWFGILHFAAAALLVARPAVRLGTWNLALAAGVIGVWLFYADPAFNAAPANVIGLVTQKPRTEDYVPLFPWLAAVFTGIGLASLWRARGFALPAALQRLNDAPPRWLVFLGTWPLTIYLLHQPVMLGLLYVVRMLGGSAP